MSTPREYLESAYGKSIKNQPDEIANEATEMLNVFIRAFRGLYAVAARVNPTFFAETASVAYSSGWARPSNAEVVWRIENSGNEVKIVPYDDQAMYGSTEAVYRFGQVYRIANSSISGSPDLDFYYAIRPTDPADLDTEVDSSWVQSYDELLVTELALYLALKDGREEEIGQLQADRDRWLALFLAFLEHETIGVERRFENIITPTSESMVPLSAILAAGTSLRT